MKTVQAEEKLLQYPCVVTRTIAAFVDVLVMGLSLLLLWEIDSFTPIPSALFYGIIAVILSYEPLATAAGASLGQYLMRIRIRRVNDLEKPISILPSYGRYLLKFTLSLASLVPLQTRDDRRAIHDLASKSIVINV